MASRKNGLLAISLLGDACCGCSACAAVCPARCIRIVPDRFGFARPCVEGESCVACGSCEKVCPALGESDPDIPRAAYWARARDANCLKSSSSGGAFESLSRSVLGRGGVVYGAAFSAGFASVSHVRVDSLEELERLKRSKYVQSGILPSLYLDIGADLEAGRLVMFSGTACQVKAVRRFADSLRGSERLMCVDVICHGVPSPKLWRTYLEGVASVEGIESVNFRCKEEGWEDYSISIDGSDGPLLVEGHGENWYMKAFLSNASIRPSCFRCPAKRACGSDLTLGDFWGVGRCYPEVERSMGVSAVVVNTGLGEHATWEASGALELGAAEYECILVGNPSLESSGLPYARYDDFMDDVASGMRLSALQNKWPFRQTLVSKLRGAASCIKSRLRSS